jgi:hypothetical protein
VHVLLLDIGQSVLLGHLQLILNHVVFALTFAKHLPNSSVYKHINVPFRCLHSSHLRRIVRISRFASGGSPSGSGTEGGGDSGGSTSIASMVSLLNTKDIINAYETDIGLRCLLRGLSPLSPALSSSLYCSYCSLRSPSDSG